MRQKNARGVQIKLHSEILANGTGILQTSRPFALLTTTSQFSVRQLPSSTHSANSPPEAQPFPPCGIVIGQTESAFILAQYRRINEVKEVSRQGSLLPIIRPHDFDRNAALGSRLSYRVDDMAH